MVSLQMAGVDSSLLPFSSFPHSGKPPQGSLHPPECVVFWWLQDTGSKDSLAGASATSLITRMGLTWLASLSCVYATTYEDKAMQEEDGLAQLSPCCALFPACHLSSLV